MASGYDRAITVFSPDGHLFQVEYALEAVSRGTTAVGVRGDNVVVLGVEKRSTSKLQDPRTVRKVATLDDHIAMTFAGLSADARVIVSLARRECLMHRLDLEDPVTVEYISRFIAQEKQAYTQSNGRRPFGISALLAGFDPDGTARLYQTDPSGIYSAWKANAIGRSSKTVREYLEKQVPSMDAKDDQAVMKMAVRALLETVQSGSVNIELAVMRRNKPLTFLPADELDALIKAIEVDKEAEAKAAKAKGTAQPGATSS